MAAEESANVIAREVFYKNTPGSEAAIVAARAKGGGTNPINPPEGEWTTFNFPGGPADERALISVREISPEPEERDRERAKAPEANTGFSLAAFSHPTSRSRSEVEPEEEPPAAQEIDDEDGDGEDEIPEDAISGISEDELNAIAALVGEDVDIREPHNFVEDVAVEGVLTPFSKIVGDPPDQISEENIKAVYSHYVGKESGLVCTSKEIGGNTAYTCGYKNPTADSPSGDPVLKKSRSKHFYTTPHEKALMLSNLFGPAFARHLITSTIGGISKKTGGEKTARLTLHTVPNLQTEEPMVINPNERSRQIGQFYPFSLWGDHDFEGEDSERLAQAIGEGYRFKGTQGPAGSMTTGVIKNELRRVTGTGGDEELANEIERVGQVCTELQQRIGTDLSQDTQDLTRTFPAGQYRLYACARDVIPGQGVEMHKGTIDGRDVEYFMSFAKHKPFSGLDNTRSVAGDSMLTKPGGGYNPRGIGE